MKKEKGAERLNQKHEMCILVNFCIHIKKALVAKTWNRENMHMHISLQKKLTSKAQNQEDTHIVI